MEAETFWELSPRELFREMEAAKLRRADDMDRDLILAWQIERVRILAANKHALPPIRQLLDEMHQTSDRQTPEQLKTQLTILSQQLGIPLRKRTREG